MSKCENREGNCINENFGVAIAPLTQERIRQNERVVQIKEETHKLLKLRAERLENRQLLRTNQTEKSLTLKL
jgi:stress response protein YsnF